MTETADQAAAQPLSAAEAAQAAIGHLHAAADVLAAAYEHPHHADRVDNVTTQLRNLASVIEAMPGQEESRADYAARLMAMHNSRSLPAFLPDHAELLLTQELERSA